MGVLAGTWLSIGLVTLDAPRPGATSDTPGSFLLLAGTAMLVPFSAAVLGTAAVRFAMTGVYQLTDDSTIEHLAGIVGLGLLAVALYAAFAFVLESSRHRPLLPTGRS